MCYLGSSIIYGDISGKLHITKMSSLLPPEGNSGLQRSNMNLSKTYNSHTSSIARMELSADGQYLFVSGTLDNAIVVYKVSVA